MADRKGANKACNGPAQVRSDSLRAVVPGQSIVSIEQRLVARTDLVEIHVQIVYRLISMMGEAAHKSRRAPWVLGHAYTFLSPEHRADHAFKPSRRLVLFRPGSEVARRSPAECSGSKTAHATRSSNALQNQWGPEPSWWWSAAQGVDSESRRWLHRLRSQAHRGAGHVCVWPCP